MIGKIGGKEYECLLDTGATKSIISPEVYLNHPNRNDLALRECRERLVSIDKSPVTVRGEVELEVDLCGTILVGHFMIAEIADDVVLGIGLQRAGGIMVNHHTQQVEFEGGKTVPYISQRISGLSKCCKVLADRTVVIPPRKEILTTGYICGRTKELEKVRGSGLVEPSSKGKLGQRGVMVGKALVDVGKDYIPIRLLNTTSEPITIYKGTPAGVVTPVAGEPPVPVETKKEPEQKRCTEKMPDFLRPLCKDGSENLSSEGKKKLAELLTKHQSAFASGPDDLGRTHLVQHEIRTPPDLRPLRQPARRFPFWKQTEAKEIVDDLLKRDLIEPSASPWAAPVVMVKKKDNTTRLCVDYRRLNSHTIQDAYPLPRIDDSLDALGGSKWFCTLDLASGYWQVGMSKSAQEKSAFITSGGLYSWKVMPFGLSTAPGTFERLMETVLSGLQWETCLIYLDDVIIFGKTEQQTLDRLDAILSRIGQAGMKLKPSKCRLFQKRVHYLGHVVTEEGVMTDPEKIETVREWPVPTTQTEVRSFLGTASYYRRFVQNFGTIARPLHRLTEKNRPFLWTTECQVAFETLRKKLVEAPILAYPSSEEDFILDTDASATGIGAVLSQVQDGVERPIAYASRGLSKSERNYSVTKRELLAVVFYCKYFRHYLIGRKFKLRTDHAALRWLQTFKDATGMWARWQNTLAEFNKEIVHRAGRSHGNADGLSRRPNEQPERGRSSDSGDPEIKSTESESPEEVEENITCLRPEENHRVAAVTIQPLWTNAEWRELQKEDPDIAPIWTRLARGEERPRWNEISEHSLATKSYWGEWQRLKMKEGVIYRKWESSDGAKVHTQVLVPRSKRKEFLQQAHGERWTAHLGVKRTVARLHEKYFWYDMRADVRSWLAQCGVCVRAKGPGGRTRKNPMTIVRSGTPFERIAIDMYGPLPETARGNSKILVITCYFTKWVEAYALPDETAETVAEALVNDFVSRYGTPVSIHSDQGRNFESTLFQEVCRLLGIRKTRTTAYHPEGNGMVERFNRTMGAMIRSLIGEEHDNWDKILPLTLMAYRSSVHETTQQTPHMMLFGREMTVPLALTMSELPTSLVEQDELEHTWDLREKLAKVHRRAREVTGQAMRRQKLQHDRGAMGHQRDVGDLVWLITKVRRQGRAAKFEHKCKGPYTVIDVMADVTYRIEDKKGKRTVVNGERLITFVKPGDWSSTDGAEDEPREHEIPTSVDSESGDDQPDLRPEKENSQRTSGRRERRAPQRYGCE